MTPLKNQIPVIGLASMLVLPMSGYAQNWSVDPNATDYVIVNEDSGDKTPFTIERGAASDTFYISTQGNLGLGNPPQLGTFSPRLYISDGSPEIEFDDIDGQTWHLFANDGCENNCGPNGPQPGGMGFQDITGDTTPFFVESAAPDVSLVVRNSGNVGVGNAIPVVDLHVLGDSADPVEELFRLESPTSPQQVFLNSGTGAQWFFAMTSTDEFKISFAGTGKVEARFQQNGNLRIAGTYQQISDRNRKKNINEIDGKDILDRVSTLPISTWEYKSDSGVKHVGPMSQDFYAAFGLGDSPTTISTIDSGGVALAAIKALKQEKDVQIEQLKDKSDSLNIRNANLQAQLEVQTEQISEQSGRILQLEMVLAEILRNQSTEVQVSTLN